MEKSSAKQKDCVCDGPSPQPCGPGCKYPYTDEPTIVEVLEDGTVSFNWPRMQEGRGYPFHFKRDQFIAFKRGDKYLEIYQEE